jgi:hypothetical protein
MSEQPLILDIPAECTSCHCNCHCDETLHISSDELDTGGPCTCEECKHEV